MALKKKRKKGSRKSSRRRAGAKRNTHLTSRAWDVIRDKKVLDTVFFARSADAAYVKRALIEHDGYPADIRVRLSKKYNRGVTPKVKRNPRKSKKVAPSKALLKTVGSGTAAVIELLVTRMPLKTSVASAKKKIKDRLGKVQWDGLSKKAQNAVLTYIERVHKKVHAAAKRAGM